MTQPYVMDTLNHTAYEGRFALKTYSDPRGLMPAESAILESLRPRIVGKTLLDIGVGGGRTTPVSPGNESRLHRDRLLRRPCTAGEGEIRLGFRVLLRCAGYDPLSRRQVRFHPLLFQRSRLYRARRPLEGAW